MDPEELALRRNVCAEPRDDDARLVYADWLSDHDREPLAEFIRLQVELTKNPICPVTIYHPRADAPNRGGKMYVAPPPRKPKQPCGWCPVCKLQEQQTYLLRNHWDEWLPLGNNHSRWTFRRGFVAELSCSAEFLLEHADALLWHPTHTVPISRECPDCWNGFLQGDDNLNEYGGVKCLTCNGSGRIPDLNWRVPAPFPPTAQPIEKVTLTTFPPAGVGAFNALRPWKCPLTWGGDTRDSVMVEWPWVTFDWPRPGQTTTGYEGGS